MHKLCLPTQLDKSLKKFVLNAIVKTLKKIEKEEENNFINVNLVIMYGSISLENKTINRLKNYIIPILSESYCKKIFN